MIEAAYSAKALLSDGSTVDIACVKAYDEALDLAILQAEIGGNECLALAEQGVKTGETVYALGSSQGLTGSFSEGIVSTAAREIDSVVCIQTTAPISQGNSGGPLVNRYGEAVGINSMTLELGQNLNFAIDVKELDKLDPSLELSLPDFYEQTVPEVTSDEQSGFWYDYSDYNEVESNDSIMLADVLENDNWVAGEISDSEDIDCFYFRLDQAQDVVLTVAPYYLDDMPYFGAELFRLGDEDLDYVTSFADFEAAEGEYIHGVRFGKDVTLTLDAAPISSPSIWRMNTGASTTNHPTTSLPPNGKERHEKEPVTKCQDLSLRNPARGFGNPFPLTKTDPHAKNGRFCGRFLFGMRG